MSGQLERLLAEATPPRRSIKSFAARMELADFIEDNGPEMARLLVDAMAKLQAGPCPGCGDDGWYVGHEDECHETGDCQCSGVQVECECRGEKAALLARFAVLEQRAGEGQG